MPADRAPHTLTDEFLPRPISKPTIFGGILALTVGVLAMIVPQVATFATESLIGALLTAGGLIVALSSMFSHGHVDRLGNLLIGLWTLAIGLFLLVFPVAGVIGLTAALSAYFFANGVLKFYFGLRTRRVHKAELAMIGAGLSIGLGIILWFALPEAAPWALGLIVGIDLTFYGMTLISRGSSATRP